MKKNEKTTNEEYCSTTYASKLLGLSVGSVHGLVDNNALLAWKTPGGHRRISLQSIHDYQKAHDYAPPTLTPSTGKLHIVLVEDDVNTQSMYQAYFESWALPLEIFIYSTAMEALIDLPDLQPMLLLTDLHMADMDGFKFIKTIREHKLFSSLLIIAATGLSTKAIEDNGGRSKDVLILRKPMDMIWLKGFLEGMINLKATTLK